MNKNAVFSYSLLHNQDVTLAMCIIISDHISNLLECYLAAAELCLLVKLVKFVGHQMCNIYASSPKLSFQIHSRWRLSKCRCSLWLHRRSPRGAVRLGVLQKPSQAVCELAHIVCSNNLFLRAKFHPTPLFYLKFLVMVIRVLALIYKKPVCTSSCSDVDIPNKAQTDTRRSIIRRFIPFFFNQNLFRLNYLFDKTIYSHSKINHL